MRVHFTDSYIINPGHLVTVSLIGLGGTGAQVLTSLARMHLTLVALGHPGLHVIGWDPDEVSEANIGRQLFSPVEVGYNKAVCLMTRINRFFGTEWEAHPSAYTSLTTPPTCNITVTCVDTAAARLDIGQHLQKMKAVKEPLKRPVYWIDFGNSHKTGQVVLGSIADIKQPKSEKFETVSTLPTVTEMFELKKIKEKDQGPSCSLAEALGKQDLYINSTIAQLGCNILWKLFRESMVFHHGLYLNLDTMSVNPIKVTGGGG